MLLYLSMQLKYVLIFTPYMQIAIQVWDDASKLIKVHINKNALDGLRSKQMKLMKLKRNADKNIIL